MGKAQEGFETQATLEIIARHIERHPAFWLWLARMESWLLSAEIASMEKPRPIYISGLARSGTTILLESIAQCPGTESHTYKDYPLVLLPYLWRKIQRFMFTPPGEPQERTHKDRIFVTADSPEAMEEAIWMTFWQGLHDPGRSNVLGTQDSNTDFETFYRNHVKKLLLATDGKRYIAKGNYNLSRISYLARLFPDAKFIITVREPYWHVASLIKQQIIFCEGLADNPLAREHLRRVGHFEFGPDRLPINFGDNKVVSGVIDAWQSGQEVSGWARYWAHVYRYVGELKSQPEVAQSVLLLRYEDLCEQPVQEISRILDFCNLRTDPSLVSSLASHISAPIYYQPEFNDTELDVIYRETNEVARSFGYEPHMGSRLET